MAKHRAVFDGIAHGPSHALFVKCAGHLVVGAEDEEIAAVHTFDEEIGSLLCRPGGGRFFAKTYHAGENEDWDQQVGCDPAALGIGKFMGERFGFMPYRLASVLRLS